MTSSLQMKQLIRVLVNQCLRRSFVAGLFVVSSLLFVYTSCLLMSRSGLESEADHQGTARSKLRGATYGEYDQASQTEDVIRYPRPRSGYYGDGYNFRKLPPDLFQLASEAFDEIPKRFLPAYKNPCFYYRGPAPFSLRCLPYFYLVGMQKCGSTDLWDKINAHYEIQRMEKEPHWWARYRVRELPKDYGLNMTSPLPLSWYLDTMSYQIVPRLVQTPETSEWLIVGDGSTSTLWDNQWQGVLGDEEQGPKYTIADVIKEIQPNAKFIVVLRDPTARAYSDYLFFGHDGDDFVSKERFHQIVSNGIVEYTNCLAKNSSERTCTYRHGTNHSRLLLGNYVVFLRDWLKVFSRDQILVLRLEDWQDDCLTVLGQIYRFLDMTPLPRSRMIYICAGDRKRVNAQMRRHIGAMLPETGTLLDEFFQPMNEELSHLLNDTRYLWR